MFELSYNTHEDLRYMPTATKKAHIKNDLEKLSRDIKLKHYFTPGTIVMIR